VGCLNGDVLNGDDIGMGLFDLLGPGLEGVIMGCVINLGRERRSPARLGMDAKVR